MELFSPGHLVVIAIVALVLFFGWKNLPDMARSLGRSLRVFKTEIKGMGEDDKAREAVRTEPPAIEAPPMSMSKPADPAPPTPPVAQAARPRPAPRPNARAEAPAKTD